MHDDTMTKSPLFFSVPLYTEKKIGAATEQILLQQKNFHVTAAGNIL